MTNTNNKQPMNTPKPTTTISSRVPKYIVDNIDTIAKNTQRSRSFHIKQALHMYAEYIDKKNIHTQKIDNFDDITLLNDWEELGVEAWNE